MVTNFDEIRAQLLSQTKKKIRESVNEDQLIIQCVSSLEELEKVVHQLIIRLREWYELYNPEFSQSIANHEKFVELIVTKTKKELLKELGITETMGRDLPKRDVDMILTVAKKINALQELQSLEEKYLEKILKTYTPNALAVFGERLVGRFIRHTGSLRKLAMTPAPVIQIMGAEEALFKHLKNKGKCPKYGFIYNHPLISKVPSKHKGKMARAIADKGALAFKLDFFKGDFAGDTLFQSLEKKAETLDNA